MPGVWKSYDSRQNRLEFVFVQSQARLPPGNLNVRRFVSLSSITEVVWEKYSWEPFQKAKETDKLAVAEQIMINWCRAILDNDELAFIEDHQLPGWRIPDGPDATIPSAPAV